MRNRLLLCFFFQSFAVLCLVGVFLSFQVERELEKAEEEGREGGVPRLIDEGTSFTSKIERMVRATKKAELISRIRAKIREEKLANSRLMKASIPNVAGKCSKGRRRKRSTPTGR